METRADTVQTAQLLEGLPGGSGVSHPFTVPQSVLGGGWDLGQIWEPRFREAKSHAQGHTGRISRTEAHTASGLNRSSYFENFHRIPYLPFLVCPRRVCTRAHVCVSLPELLVV